MGDFDRLDAAGILLKNYKAEIDSLRKQLEKAENGWGIAELDLKVSEEENKNLHKQLEEMTKNADFYQGQYLATRFENDILKIELVKMENKK